MTLDQVGPPLIATLALALIAMATLWWGRVPGRFAPLTALARATLQLAVLSLVLHGVIDSLPLVLLAILVMYVAAVLVSSRRQGGGARTLLTAALAIAAGAIVATGAVFGTGALAFEPKFVLAYFGILIGNTMTIATLSGRRFNQTVIAEWNAVEGMLALGATPKQSVGPVARLAIRESLVPSIDQTRTTGLVVLPGAFVGAIFAGLPPLDAGIFQLLVLAGILAGGAVTATLAVQLAGTVAHKPQPVQA